MPPIRSVLIRSTGVTVTSYNGTRTMRFTTVPSTLATAAQAEAFLNTWAAANSSGYQLQFHVVTRTPLEVTAGTWNLGEPVSSGWWAE